MSEFDKEIREMFSTEYYVCGKCGHSWENHYWNGGGRVENSGYDACHVEGCDCGYPENQTVKVEYDEEAIKKFKQKYLPLSTLKQVIEDLGEKSGEVSEIEAPEEEPYFLAGYNKALSDVLTAITKIQEGK